MQIIAQEAVFCQFVPTGFVASVRIPVTSSTTESTASVTSSRIESSFLVDDVVVTDASFLEDALEVVVVVVVDEVLLLSFPFELSSAIQPQPVKAPLTRSAAIATAIVIFFILPIPFRKITCDAGHR